VHPSEIKIGDLITTEYGLAHVMKFFAPAFIGCVVVTPTGRDKVEQGEWIYLRGLDLERAKPVTENDTYLKPSGEKSAHDGIRKLFDADKRNDL